MNDDYQILWGDIHRQTSLTCGDGNYQDHFDIAREQGLDFVAVTDNATLTEDPRVRQFAGEKLSAHRHFYPALEAHSITREAWDELRQFTRNLEGKQPIFLLGYEWCSNRYGDRNVYYLDDGPLALPPEIHQLHASTAANEALVVVHHTGYARGRRGADWNHHDGRSERLVEIFSTQQGSSEGLREAGIGEERPLYSRSMGALEYEGSVLSALARRYKLGFTAGSDLHSFDQKPGRTGVLVRDASKQALWDALWDRRTIATTGPSFPFRFRVEGMDVGSILTTDRLPTVTATLPEDGWSEAQLVHNGRVAKTWQRVQEPRGELRYEETSERVTPDNYYYLRVSLDDGHVAWSSPIWLSLLPDTPPFRDTLYWLPEERCIFWARVAVNGSLEVSIFNGYRAGAAAGGLLAPDDVTLRDLEVQTIASDRTSVRTNRVHASNLGSLSEGGELKVEVPRPSAGQRLRVSFLDPFGNRRHIERGDWLSAGEEPPFRRQSRSPH